MLDRVESQIEVFKEQILAQERLVIVGGSSKRTQSSEDLRPTIDTRPLHGIVEYDPSEFTMTALAGTPLRDLELVLSANGQYLPFDPPRTEAGATLGGMIAAGVSGPCRMRYGGMRDFILGVRMLDGRGHLVTAGGKVVKNAAGFDLPKMMVGSWGSLGLLVQATFKVFPRPEAFRTIVFRCASPSESLNVSGLLVRQPVELDGLDWEPPHQMLVRVGGRSNAVERLAERVRKSVAIPGEILQGIEEGQRWRPLREWSWHGCESSFVRVPIVPTKIELFDHWLDKQGADRRYSVGGNLLWIGWPKHAPLSILDAALREAGLSGRILLSPSQAPNVLPTSLLGMSRSHRFADAVREALFASKWCDHPF